MPQAKPAAKPAAVAAPAATPAPPPPTEPEDAPEPAPKRVQKSWEKIKVKNIGKRCLNLTHGPIERDKTGTATVAEFSCLAQFMEKV